MVDESLYRAGFLKEKKEDIDFLQGIDYKALQKKVDRAIASGSAQQIHEVVAEIDSYDDQVNRERSSVPVPHLDQKIKACVEKYTAVQESLREGIEGYLKTTTAVFNKEYNAKSPNIAKLRNISEDYSTFEGKACNLNDLILQYAGFSKTLKTVETEISSSVADYKNVAGKKQLQAVDSRIKQSRKKIEKIKSKAPKKGIFGLGGIHKAYDYRNGVLERLSLEMTRFEKEDFAKRRKHAKKDIAVAEDFMDFLQCANDEEIFTIFEDYAKLSFSDVSSFVGTIYFSEVAKNHSTNLRNLRKLAREQALECKEKSIESLNAEVDRILNDTEQPVEYFQNQQTIIEREYKKKSSILGRVVGRDKLEGDSFDDAIDANLGRINSRIASIQQRTAKEEELRLKAEKIRSNSKLRKAKDEFAKKEQTYQRQQKENQKKIEEIAKEKSAIARRLEENEKKRKNLQGRVSQLNQQYTQLQGKIDQSSRTLAQELTTQFRKELEDVKKAYSDTDQSKKKDYAALKAKLDQLTNGIGAMEQNIQSVSTESAEKINQAYQDLRKEIAKKPNLSEKQLQDKLKPLYAKMDQVTDMTKAEKKSILLEIYDRLFGKKEDKKEQSEKSANKSSISAVKDEITKEDVTKAISDYAGSSASESEEIILPFTVPRQEKEEDVILPFALQKKEDELTLPFAVSKKENLSFSLQYTKPENRMNMSQDEDTISVNLEIKTNKGKKTEEAKRPQEMYDFVGALEQMPFPSDNHLYSVRKRIVDGDGFSGLTERIESLSDLFSQNSPLIETSYDVDWLKDFRKKLVNEINFGLIDLLADKKKLDKSKFNDLISDSIDPYIAKCEAALLTKV